MVSSASYYHGAMKRQLLISVDRNNEIGHTHLLLLIAIFSRFMTYVIRLFTRYYEHRMMLQRITQLFCWLHLSFSCCNQYRFYNAQIPKIYSLPSPSFVDDITDILKKAEYPQIWKEFLLRGRKSKWPIRPIVWRSILRIVEISWDLS